MVLFRPDWLLPRRALGAIQRLEPILGTYAGVKTGQGKIVAQRASNAKHGAYYNGMGKRLPHSAMTRARNPDFSADRPTSVSCRKLL
jgi:hypothetical protein